MKLDTVYKIMNSCCKHEAFIKYFKNVLIILLKPNYIKKNTQLNKVMHTQLCL